MSQTEKTYSKVTEAEEMIEKLVKKYPELLWQIKPRIVTVLGVENKERSKNCHKLAQVKAVRGAEKAVMQIHNVDVRYIIELYWSDWNAWSVELKQWIVLHELLHVSFEIGKVIKHDCEDFRIILDAVGVDWTNKVDGLPNLLREDVKFNLNLRPNVPSEEEVELANDEILPDDSEKEESPEKENGS